MENKENKANWIIVYLPYIYRLPSKRFESHSESANGLKRPFGVKNDKYGPCHRADLYKYDTLSRSQNPENDTLLSGTSPYGKIYEYLPRATGSIFSLSKIEKARFDVSMVFGKFVVGTI